MLDEVSSLLNDNAKLMKMARKKLGEIDPKKAKAFQEFKKDLMEHIQEQISDDLKRYKITIIEDDDFCLFVKENTHMNSYEKFKLTVYESGLDFEDACEVIDLLENCDDEELEEVVESVLELVEEAMTVDDIRIWTRFSKRYDVSSEDKDGNRTMILDGQRVKISKPKNDVVISTDPFDGSLKIDFEKLCKIPHDDEIDAVIQHEDGHRKLHTINPRCEAMDKKRTDEQLRADVAHDILQKVGTGNRTRDDYNAGKVEDLIDTPLSKKDRSKMIEKLVKERKKFRVAMKRSHVKEDSYIDANELEADQCAANKVGVNTLIRALQSMDKLDREYARIDLEKKLENAINSKEYKNLKTDSERELHLKKIRKISKRECEQGHREHIKETKIRRKALKDPSINTDTRKLLSD